MPSSTNENTVAESHVYTELEDHCEREHLYPLYRVLEEEFIHQHRELPPDYLEAKKRIDIEVKKEIRSEIKREAEEERRLQRRSSRQGASEAEPRPRADEESKLAFGDLSGREQRGGGALGREEETGERARPPPPPRRGDQVGVRRFEWEEAAAIPRTGERKVHGGTLQAHSRLEREAHGALFIRRRPPRSEGRRV